MVQLLEDFWVVSGERLTHPWDASAYLLGGEEPTLIDCGSTLGYPALKASLNDKGFEPGDIRRVIATHGHWDHLSAMAQLRQESDAELWIHEADAAQVERGDDKLTAASLYRVPFPPVKVDRLLQDGETLAVNGLKLEVIHTPGHTAGSLSFRTVISGLKVLIAGDALWGGFHASIGSSIEAWTCSLDRLCQLDVDVLTFGHSPPSLHFDAKRRLNEAREQFGVYFNPWFKPFHTTFRY